MNLILKFSLFISCLIVVSVMASLENPHDGRQGLTPHQGSLSTLEEQVFDPFHKKPQKHESLHNENLENRITQLVSHYKTGLKKDHLSGLSEKIIYESKKYGYDPLFLTAIIITESSFNNWARSNKGALGLMQIRPATGKELARETRVQWKGKPTLFDPKTNIALGAYYLNKLVLRFGDLGLALEAYNHGPSRLERYLRKGYRPKSYSKKVFRNYSLLRAQAI